MSETFGQALRRLRGSLSVRDLARLANCGKSYISDLENSKRRPAPQLAAALDQALGAGGQLITLASVRPGASAIEQANAIRQGLSGTIAAGPMTEASVEEWEYTVDRHGRATRYRPANEHLAELTADLADLRRLLSHRNPQVRQRLTIAAAQMSGLVALTLLKLGDSSSRDWWRTGRMAAAAADDKATLSWMYAHEAYQLYYSGDLFAAIELASRAQHTGRGTSSVGVAIAAPLVARAQAFLGRRHETEAALVAASKALQELSPDHCVSSALGYNEGQFRFHSGNAWTYLGETTRAREELSRALELYPEVDCTDRALVRLDQAACAAAEGDSAGAAASATATIVQLSVDQRSSFVLHRARELVGSIPEANHDIEEVRMLKEIMSLPFGGPVD